MPTEDHRAVHMSLHKWKNGKYDRLDKTQPWKDLSNDECRKDMRDFYDNADGGRWKKYLPDLEKAFAETK